MAVDRRCCAHIAGAGGPARDRAAAETRDDSSGGRARDAAGAAGGQTVAAARAADAGAAGANTNTGAARPDPEACATAGPGALSYARTPRRRILFTRGRHAAACRDAASSGRGAARGSAGPVARARSGATDAV